MSQIEKLFLSMFIVICSSAAWAEDAKPQKCLDPELVKYALSNFKIQDLTDDVVTKEYTEQDACDQGTFKYILEGLDFLRKTPNKKIPSNYQTLITKEGPTEFLKKRVKIIQLRKTEKYDHRCHNAAAFVSSAEIDQKIMHVCPVVEASSTQTNAQTLVHEARHIDGFRHVECDHGFFSEKDNRACDNNYLEQGSFGIALGYNFLVYFGTKNEAVKQTARALIVLESLHNFNSPPLGLVKGGVFLDDQNMLSFYDGSQEYRFAEFTDDTAALSLSIGIPYVFFKNGNVVKYAFTRKWHLQDNKFSRAYQKLSSSDRNSVIDALTGEENCFLLPDTVKCLDRDDTITSMDVSSLKPTRFFSFYHREDQAIRVYTGEGAIYYLPGSILFKELSLKDGFLTNDFHYPEVTSFAKMENGKIMGITPKGFMVEKKTKDAPWTRAKVFGDYTFKKIVPFYWSKRLEDL